jgi:hypothetical protein
MEVKIPGCRTRRDKGGQRSRNGVEGKLPCRGEDSRPDSLRTDLRFLPSVGALFHGNVDRIRREFPLATTNRDTDPQKGWKNSGVQKDA